MSRRLSVLALLVAGLGFLLFLSPIAFEESGRSPMPGGSKQQANIAAVRRQAVQRAIPKLDWADAESRRIAGNELAAIDRFFDDAKDRTPAFAGKVLGWSSKWRFVADRVPLTRGDRHDEFLRKAFNEQLFTPEQLAKVVERAIQNELNALTGVENQMLVRIRADLEDLPPNALPAAADQQQWSAAYEQALATARARIASSLKTDLSSEVTSLIAGEVMTLVAIRLGVSAGVLAAGAGSTLPTLGIGLVVSLIVDQLVAWVWDWWQDPRGELAAEVNRKLDEMRKLILDGDGVSPGLRGRMEEFVRARATLRREAVLSMLNPVEGKK
jgi:hypothetical protein